MAITDPKQIFAGSGVASPKFWGCKNVLTLGEQH